MLIIKRANGTKNKLITKLQYLPMILISNQRLQPFSDANITIPLLQSSAVVQQVL
jgi:hypothetical protein